MTTSVYRHILHKILYDNYDFSSNSKDLQFLNLISILLLWWIKTFLYHHFTFNLLICFCFNLMTNIHAHTVISYEFMKAKCFKCINPFYVHKMRHYLLRKYCNWLASVHFQGSLFVMVIKVMMICKGQCGNTRRNIYIVDVWHTVITA